MPLMPGALLRTVWVVLLLLGTVSPAVFARPLEIEDELQRAEPAAVRFSPDGRLVAVTVRRLDGFERHWNEAARADSDDGVRRSAGHQLLIVEAATQRVLYRSDPAVSAIDPVWTNDGRSVAFFVRGAHTTQIWKWHRAGGKVQKSRGQADSRLYAIPGQSFQLTADPDWVLVRLDRGVRAIPQPAESWQPRVLTANSSGAEQPLPALAKLRMDLYLWNLRTDERRSIEENTGMYHASVSPDGAWVAYWRYQGHELAPRTVYFFDLFVYDIEQGRSKQLASRVQLAPREAAIFWAPDSRRFAYFSHLTTGAETLLARSLWSVDLGSGTLQRLVDNEREGRLTGGKVFWKKSGAAFVASSTQEPGTGESAWKLPAGAGNPLPSPTGDMVLFTQQAADVPPGLWMMRGAEQTPQPFAGLVPSMAGIGLGRSRLIEFFSSDGVQLKAALLLPHGYQEGTRVPMVVWVYPGNQSRAVNIYGLGGRGPMNAQLLASRGYAVLKPDSVMHDGYPVESLARSILPAVTAAINMGVADPQRIGLWGHSQGGMSTLALLTRSTIFKAAVASNGYYDLVSFYGSLDRRGRDGAAHILEEYNHVFTTPWRNQRVYLDNSPILNLDRVTAPFLMVVGMGDSSVPDSQAEEVFVGLKRLGTKVALAEYPSATHVPFDWETKQQIDYANRLLAWYGEHLSPRPQAAAQ